MIFDKIEHINTYLGLSKNLDIAIQEIKSLSFIHWKNGKHEVFGKDVFCNIVNIDTKDEMPWERHEKYLDIHIVIQGDEVIRCAEFNSISGWDKFNELGDCAIAPYSPKGVDIKLEPGSFLIVFPQDAHIPGLKNTKLFSQKSIFKVRIN